MNTDSVKANALVTAVTRCGGGVYPGRILTAALMQFAAGKRLEPGRVFTIRAADLAALAGSKARRTCNYRRLAAAAKVLEQSFVFVKELPNGGGGLDEHKRLGVMHRCRYIPGSGEVRVIFHSDILPYISSLRNNFTPINPFTLLSLKSKYSQRLYELLSHSALYRIDFTIDNLRGWLGAQDVCRDARQFRRAVIERAVAEINLRTNLQVVPVPLYSGVGGRLTRFRFDITHTAPPRARPAPRRRSRAAPKPPASPLPRQTRIAGSGGAFAESAEDIRARKNGMRSIRQILSKKAHHPRRE